MRLAGAGRAEASDSRPVNVCDLYRGDGQLVGGSKTSVPKRAVEIPTGGYFHSLSMRNKSEWV